MICSFLQKNTENQSKSFVSRIRTKGKKHTNSPTLGINRVTIVSFKFDSEFLTRWGIKERLYSQDNIFSKKSRVS